MFVAVGPSGHFSIVSWSACALSNKGSWFPMFIFCELLPLCVSLVCTFVATLIVYPLISNIYTLGLFHGVRKCSNTVFCVFELSWGALEVLSVYLFCFEFVLSVDQGELYCLELLR